MASDDAYLGSISMTGFPWAVQGYARCDGALVPIAQNPSLFAVLGVLYGGNATTLFALPDLQGRLPLGAGAGDGLTPRQPGQQLGTEQVSLMPANLPEHVHEVSLGGTGSGQVATTSGTASGGGAVTGPAGGGAPVPIMPPVLGVTFQISVLGVFPSRDY
jgi:microcystin-dependent protein